MIGNAEHWPNCADASRPDEVAPAEHNKQTCGHIRKEPIRSSEWRIKLPDELLDNESRHASPGIDRRQNEECLEHDGEVIPIGHQSAHAGYSSKDLRHTHSQ